MGPARLRELVVSYQLCLEFKKMDQLNVIESIVSIVHKVVICSQGKQNPWVLNPKLKNPRHLGFLWVFWVLKVLGFNGIRVLIDAYKSSCQKRAFSQLMN